MRLPILSLATLALTAPFLAQQLPAQQQTVHCSARDQPRNFCPADTHNGAVLIRDDSRGTCVQGTTWEIRQDGIRVSNGCSGDFLVNAGPAFVAGPPPGQPQGAAYGNAYGGGERDQRDHERPRPIFSGADFDVQLDQTLRPGVAQQGDTLPGHLAADLVAQDGRVIALQGTSVLLRVTSAQGSPLDLRVDSMAIGPVSYTLRTTAVHGLRDSVGGVPAGDKRGLGGFVNSINGGPELPRGSEFHFQLTQQAEPTFAGRQ